MLSCTAQTMVPPVSTGSAAGRGAYQVTTSPSMTSSPSGCPKRQAPGRMHRWLRQGRQLRMGDLLPSTFGSVAHSHTQDSGSAQVSDGPKPDCRMCPRKPHFTTEPPHVRSVHWWHEGTGPLTLSRPGERSACITEELP